MIGKTDSSPFIPWSRYRMVATLRIIFAILSRSGPSTLFVAFIAFSMKKMNDLWTRQSWTLGNIWCFVRGVRPSYDERLQWLLFRILTLLGAGKVTQVSHLTLNKSSRGVTRDIIEPVDGWYHSAYTGCSLKLLSWSFLQLFLFILQNMKVTIPSMYSFTTN